MMRVIRAKSPSVLMVGLQSVRVQGVLIERQIFGGLSSVC